MGGVGKYRRQNRRRPTFPVRKRAPLVVDGLEQAPRVINRLFDGANTGKLIIKLCEEP